MSQITRFQKFDVRRLDRSEIKNAPYNPRIISPYSRGLLKKGISDVGLVETLVWNETTGNLVGGHQRLSILDELEGGKEYALDVAVVHLDPDREKELVVFLNNQNTQGMWNEDLISQLVTDPALQIENMGFTIAALQIEFPDLAVAGKLPTDEEPAGEDAGETGEAPAPQSVFSAQEAATEQMAADIAAIKEARKRGKDTAWNDPQVDADYYLVVCFNSRDDKNQFLRVNNMGTDATHVTADELMPMLQPKHLWRSKPDETPVG